MTLVEPVFIDSNVPMYAAGADHPLRNCCIQVLARIRDGSIAAITNVEVHQEILHRYLALGQDARARQVSEDFEVILSRVLPVTVTDVARARLLSRQYPSLPARDLIHVATMLQNGISVIISADRHFDLVPEVTRRDPSAV